MALSKIKTGSITDAAVERDKIKADAIDATKLADDAVSEEHLDNTAITGHTELAAVAEDNDVLLVFDTSAGALKKIQSSNVGLQNPTFSSVSPTSLSTGDGTGNHTIVVTGSRFDASAVFKIRTDGGSDIAMDSVTRNSSTQLTGVVAKNTSGITNANEPFDIVITNGNGLAVVSENQLNIDAQPVYATSAGTLGTVTGGSAITTIDIVATDPESAGNVTFEFQSGSLPAGLSSATVNENGVSKFRITGTPTNPDANTTTNFTLRAADAASNVSSRAFSITVNRAFTSTSFTSSGTFAVPSGVTSLSAVLVVAGGGGGPGQHASGGGAGGLVFMPDYPVVPGGTIAVTVGNGGAKGPGSGASSGQNSVFGDSPSPGKHPSADALTAQGGGRGGHYSNTSTGPAGAPGGSGGGAGVHEPPPSVNPNVGTGTQPTAPGDSGAYGFGNPGGTSISGYPAPFVGGGGGGAGAAGGNATPTVSGAGGVGKAYTIADGTTPVYYAGGGGGGKHCGPSYCGTASQGGGGAGGSGSAQDGQANKGGGGGSSPSHAGTDGGKGIVIVRY